MKKLIYILFFILFAVSVSAQVRGVVIDLQGEPLLGVNVFWAETTIGTATNERGEFAISQTSQTNRLVFSSVLFKNDTITVSDPNAPIRVTLSEALELEEVSIVQQRMGTLRPRMAVLQTEVITTHELSRAACCNLSEAFETNPSVDVIFSDAATGAKQIRLLGLSGAYVQMLTENIPNLRGISSIYGLGFIPGPWIESIHVSKGAGSVINGHEAITGQINVEYKKPHTSEQLFTNLFFSDMGRVEANVNASTSISDKLSTGILLHASDDFRNLDHDGTDFRDKPRIRQFNAVNRWLYADCNFISQIFVRGLYENRRGGQIAGDYKIGIETARYEFFTKNGYMFNHEKNTSIGLILSGSQHEQNAFFGRTKYSGTQGNIYANLIFHTDFNETNRLSAGTSYNFDNFNENVSIPNEIPNEMLRREHTPGAFAEYTFCNGTFSAIAGLRGDYNSHFDRFFVTPRLHLRYQVSEFVHLRASAGKGFRSPNIWAENNFLLASSRRMIVADNLKMEEAWNYGFSVNTYIPLFGRELRLMGEWFYTDFIQQIVIDMDADAREVRFYNLNDDKSLANKSFASNLQFEASMEIVKGLTATLAHRINDTQMTINGTLREKPFVNRYRSMITASYQTPQNGWQFDFTTQFHGGGRLPNPSVTNPLWNREFKPFTTMMAQITRHFRTWSVYLGSENLTGFVQPNPIIGVENPFGSDFDATMIWGPTDGRMIYVGFNWTLDRK